MARLTRAYRSNYFSSHLGTCLNTLFPSHLINLRTDITCLKMQRGERGSMNKYERFCQITFCKKQNNPRSEYNCTKHFHLSSPILRTFLLFLFKPCKRNGTLSRGVCTYNIYDLLTLYASETRIGASCET